MFSKSHSLPPIRHKQVIVLQLKQDASVLYRKVISVLPRARLPVFHYNYVLDITGLIIGESIGVIQYLHTKLISRDWTPIPIVLG